MEDSLYSNFTPEVLKDGVRTVREGVNTVPDVGREARRVVAVLYHAEIEGGVLGLGYACRTIAGAGGLPMGLNL